MLRIVDEAALCTSLPLLCQGSYTVLPPSEFVLVPGVTIRPSILDRMFITTTAPVRFIKRNEILDSRFAGSGRGRT
jgi:hypothetical protein